MRNDLLRFFVPDWERVEKAPTLLHWSGFDCSEKEYQDLIATLLNKSSNVLRYDEKQWELDREAFLTQGELLKIIRKTDWQSNWSAYLTQLRLHPDVLQNRFILKALEKLQKEYLKDKTPPQTLQIIVRLMTELKIRLSSVAFNLEMRPKCLWFGYAGETECLYMVLLQWLGFDVLWLSDLRTPLPPQAEFLHKTGKKQVPNNILANITDYAKKGQIIEEGFTTGHFEEKVISQQMEQASRGDLLYDKWSLKKSRSVKPLFLNCTFLDLKVYNDQEVKFRQGFQIKDEEVVVPNYLFLIEGEEYGDPFKYVRLLKHPASRIVLNNELDCCQDVSEYNKYAFFLDKGGLLSTKIYKEEEWTLKQYNTVLQELVFNKINEVLQRPLYGTQSLSRKVRARFVASVLKQPRFELLQNWDFNTLSPNILIYLENQESLSDESLLVIAFYQALGFDILVFSPAGLSGLDRAGIKYNVQRLDHLVRDRKFDKTLGVEEGLGDKVKRYFSQLFK